MEVSPYRGTYELGMEDDVSLINQWLSSSDELKGIPLFAEDLQQSFPHTTIKRQHGMNEAAEPAKQIKTNIWDSSLTDHLSNPRSNSSSSVISFDSSNYKNQHVFVKPKVEARVVSPKIHSAIQTSVSKTEGSFENQNYGVTSYRARANINVCNRSSQSQDHIIAERKRREKLSQRFIALSAVLPGLKKTDKASVLGDAIKHMKQLQEQVKTLEEKTRKRTVESVVFVKKSKLFYDGDNSLNNEGFTESSFEEAFPEIEARFSGKDVILKIHCERKKGLMETIVSEIEKLHLTIVNTSIISFGSHALDITIVAQMDEEFILTVKDLVKVIRSNLQIII